MIDELREVREVAVKAAYCLAEYDKTPEELWQAHLAAVATLDKLIAEQDGEGVKLSDPPCSRCGYNGAGYYQPSMHSCAALHEPAVDEMEVRSVVKRAIQEGHKVEKTIYRGSGLPPIYEYPMDHYIDPKVDLVMDALQSYLRQPQQSVVEVSEKESWNAIYSSDEFIDASVKYKFEGESLSAVAMMAYRALRAAGLRIVRGGGDAS